MIALAADDRGPVDTVYAKAIGLGGGSEGAPGMCRSEEIGFYGEYFRDPDVNRFRVYKVG